MRVLIVDDDPSIRRTLSRAFTLEGFDAKAAGGGAEAFQLLLSDGADVIVLDVAMAGLSGLGFCQALRAAGDTTPVLMLTARDTVADRVTGLDAGADDYLTKPFALVELFARVRALTRRGTATTNVRAVSDLTLDEHSQIARRGSRTIRLTGIETTMLTLLMDHRDQTISRRSLADAIWGVDHAPRSNAIDVYVRYLRQKLEEANEPRLIHTVRGIGYCLSAS